MKTILTFLFTVFALLLYAQQSTEKDAYRIAFYNVENLFDPENDSLTHDDAYTPDGLNRWTYGRFHKKVNNIAKVILAMGNFLPPDVIGLAEVENLNVLKKLCYQSPLKKYNYKIIHYDSPDSRGIEVGLLYNPGRVSVLYSEPIGIVFPFDTLSGNRDILYVIMQFPGGDSLHIFMNHWTSRFGGYAPTIKKRNYYASVLKERTDTILARNPAANIVIMGDFNDYPTDESMDKILSAKRFVAEEETAKLYNLMCRFLEMRNIGTHKHEDFWGCLDQCLVSRSLLQDGNGITVTNREAHIFMADFMIEADEKYGGYKLFRTFLGPKYLGGYSDHLPIYIELKIREKSRMKGVISDDQ